MSPLGILLVTVSAFTHALWNLLTKRARGTAAFFFLVNGLGALAFLPLGLWGALGPGLPARAWAACAGSGLALAVYFAGLGWSYERGDMSIIYPLVRAIPVAAVALIDWARRGGIRPGAALGMALVAAGCLWLGREQSRRAGPGGRGGAAALAFVLLTAAGTVAYSLLDEYAMRFVRGAGGAYLYVYWEFALTALFLAPLLALRPERAYLQGMKSGDWRLVGMVSFLNLLTYGLVVWALQTSKVSYVVAFRQLSIVVGVVLAGAVLGEERLLRRAPAAGAVFAGVLLVGLSDVLGGG